ncbi:hypothetical protein [Micromonospora sp. NBC_01796]|uniref:hypothetical protein n=1 Tax=Micromonospora sp. NBC_01796 TaxID=2975987 RepID=UPI002DD92000|nr:hypothetical protein [Micromonospora sp. NBC_01796]WSA83083.1 hypothetical protein OIE47_21990 [Micromonospora sp. NBC_01796]
MGLFNRVPEDLKEFEDKVQGLAGHMGGLRFGTPAGLVRELSAEVTQEAALLRARLTAQGREKDLKTLRKAILSNGKFLDNGTYNHLFYPFVKSILP